MTLVLVLVVVAAMLVHGWAMLMALWSAFRHAANDISFGYKFGGAFFLTDFNRKYLRISLASMGTAIVCFVVWSILVLKGMVTP